MKSILSILLEISIITIIFISNTFAFEPTHSFNSNDNASNINSTGSLNSSISITYTQKPKHMQFITRDASDSGTVTIAGRVVTSGYDSMYMDLYKNNVYQKRKTYKLVYSGGNAPFSISHRIHSELSEYKFHLYILDAGTPTYLTSVDSIICGDAYIICGQSNSDRTSSSATYKNEYCRTFGVQTIDFNYTPYITSDTAFSLSVANAPNFYTQSYTNVGVWGLKLQKLIKENFGIPTCIINGGLGGSLIEVNLRNNSNPTDLSTAYGKLLYRVSKAGLTSGIKAIFWYQGESNGNSSWVNYATNFNTLYNSWKENYPNFNRIFLFQTRPCCTELYSSQLREVQRNLPYTYKDIEILSSNGILDFEGWHFEYAGYNSIADMVYIPVCQKFYTATDTTHSKPPNIRAAYFTNPTKNVIALLFENSAVANWPNDTLGQSMKNYFYLNGAYGSVTTGSVSGDTLRLYLTGTSSANKITYLPSVTNNNNSYIYQGPFLKNPKNLGILSFHDYPISNYAPVLINIKLIPDGSYNTSTGRMNSCETVNAYLRNNYFPYTIIDSAKASIDSVTFNSKFIFRNLPQGTYYIVIKGSNLLETWSKNPGIVINAGSTISYDFTTSSTQAFGNNLKLKGGKYCIYNSDINQDGFIDGLDNMRVGNDAYSLISGNVNSDVNGDYFVDGTDMTITDYNCSHFITKITP